MNEQGVSIVIPVWNGRELLLRLLEKLQLQTFPIAEVLVIDNGSEDGAAEAAEQNGAQVVRMGSNQGFSRAVNKGIETCRTELVALVNSDVEPEPDWLRRLVDALDSSGAWFATGKILSASEPNRIDGTYDLLCRSGCAWRKGEGRLDGPEFSQQRSISIAPATAALFRADLFQRAGRFDEAFESYLEDVDFGLRCALRDLKGVYVPDAVAYHRGSAALGRWNPRTVRQIARNQVLLVAKHYPPTALRRYWWPILVGQSLWGLVALRHGAGGAFLRGKLEGLRYLRSAPPARDCGRLPGILQDGEREIAEEQRRTRFDFYWRMYFLFTSSEAD